jgi:acetyl esterase
MRALALIGRVTPTAAAVAFGAASSCGAADSPPLESRAWEAFNQPAPPAAAVPYVPEGAGKQVLEIHEASRIAGSPPGPAPVLLLVHGGGWSGGSRDALAPHACYFAARGWVCINVSYRLTSEPGVTLQKAAEDIRAAFGWVRAEASRRAWDANRISVLGESAGGQLACALGVLPPEPGSWRAQRLVLVNPVLDLTALSWALTVPGVKEAGPVDPRARGKHPAWTVSPLFHLRKDSPPILLLHGRDDTSVPFAQADAFTARGRAVGASVELVGLDGTGHAFLLREFGQPELIRATLQRIAQFLERP